MSEQTIEELKEINEKLIHTLHEELKQNIKPNAYCIMTMSKSINYISDAISKIS